jgi:hypothetical protein
MSRRPVMMEGISEFYPFCYLLIAADTALDAAKLELSGRNYHYVTAIVFSAFAVEAAINHVGIDLDPNWASDERKLGGWVKKLEKIATKFSMQLDFSTGTTKTVKEAFEVRDRLAHGKTWVGEQRYLDSDNGIRDESFPDWLEPCFCESRAEQVIQDAREFIETLLHKAGYAETDLHSMGQSSYEEVSGPALKAVWKIKGT